MYQYFQVLDASRFGLDFAWPAVSKILSFRSSASRPPLPFAYTSFLPLEPFLEERKVSNSAKGKAGFKPKAGRVAAAGHRHLTRNDLPNLTHGKDAQPPVTTMNNIFEFVLLARVD